MCVIKRFGWVMCTYAFVEKEGERETGKVFEKQRERERERVVRFCSRLGFIDKTLIVTRVEQLNKLTNDLFEFHFSILR